MFAPTSLPTITRTENNNRKASGAPATGIYATLNADPDDAFTDMWFLYDETDRQIDSGRTNGPELAQIIAASKGATFLVTPPWIG